MPTFSGSAVQTQTGSIQSYTIPTTGRWRIEARGGGGGGTSTGKGAVIIGDFSLNAGEVLDLVVGGMGFQGTGGTSGGGGGSFVWKRSGTALLIAAGGGAGNNSNAYHANCDASLTTSGKAGSHGAGGTGGGGGGCTSGWGSGGAGWAGDGTHAPSGTASDGTGKQGKSRVNGSYPFRGGGADSGAVGAYGGGGGSHGNTGGGGGGGGYSGGGGSDHSYGGGGGSFIAAGAVNTSSSVYGSVTGGTVVVTLMNSAPSTPGAFVSPTSGEVVNSTDIVEAGASTDAQGSVSYEWDLSLDGGTTYTNRRSAQAGNSWTFDYSTLPEITNAKWRVRAYDGEFWSGYSYSALFRIHHPTAPTAATNLAATPTTVIIGDIVRVSWQHNDVADRFPDPQQRYQIRWRKTDQPAPAAPTLPTITGLQAHLDASALTSTDGTAITSAPAVGGTTAWTVQGTGPIYKTGGVNGKPFLRQTSAGTGLRWNQSVTGDNTVFVVARQHGTTSQRILSGLNNNYLLGWWSTGEDRHFSEGWVHNPTVPATTNLRCYIGRRAGTTTTFWRGPTQLASNTAGTAGPNGLTTNGYTGVSEFSDSDVYEVIAYNRALTDDEVRQVEVYLATKYAMR